MQEHPADPALRRNREHLYLSSSIGRLRLAEALAVQPSEAHRQGESSRYGFDASSKRGQVNSFFAKTMGVLRTRRSLKFVKKKGMCKKR